MKRAHLVLVLSLGLLIVLPVVIVHSRPRMVSVPSDADQAHTDGYREEDAGDDHTPHARDDDDDDDNDDKTQPAPTIGDEVRVRKQYRECKCLAGKPSSRLADERCAQCFRIGSSSNAQRAGFYLDHKPWASESEAQDLQREQCQSTQRAVVAARALNLGKEASDLDQANEDLKKTWPLHAMSPPRVPTRVTDLREALKANDPDLQRIYEGTSEAQSDAGKVAMNKRGLTLNWHMVDGVEKHNVPIWLRVFSRTQPLDKVIDGLRSMEGKERTVLYISVDGAHKHVLQFIAQHVDFMPARILFHAFTHDVESFPELKTMDPRVARLNSHFNYGMRLLFDVFGYGYVALLEDDIMPGPDFYMYHRDMMPYALLKPDKVFSVGAIMHGPINDCDYIANKLLNRGSCRLESMNHLVLEQYYTTWGSGMPRHTFMEYWPHRWTNIYDGIFSGLIGKRWHVTPCSHRAKWLPNSGTNGTGGKRWNHDLPLLKGEHNTVYHIEQVDGFVQTQVLRRRHAKHTCSSKP